MTPAQFIVVRIVPLGDGKSDKLPLSPMTMQPADAHDPANWLPYETAAAAAREMGPGYGVGFVLTPEAGIWCLDIDNCIEGDAWTRPEAASIVDKLPWGITERSNSGRGIHIWGRDVLPEGHRTRSTANAPVPMELYSRKRFILLGTAGVKAVRDACRNAPIHDIVEQWFPAAVRNGPSLAAHGEGPCPEWRGPVDDDDLIRRARQSRSTAAIFGGGAHASFDDLWVGNADVLARAYPSTTDAWDQSAADMALATHLAFWTGRDAERIERLMRRSALVRGKWDRPDYLPQRTIPRACAQARDVCRDRAVAPVAALGEAPAPAVPGGAPAARETFGKPTFTFKTGSTFLDGPAAAKMLDGCVYILDQNKALIPGGDLLDQGRFRARFGGYTWIMAADNGKTTRNAWEAFTENQLFTPPMAKGTCFRPDLPYGELVFDAGRSRANTWWPVETPRSDADVTPFLEHVARLVPDERDRTILLSWLACCVQFPGRKFQCAVFIQGGEGNGKSFISRAMADIMGKRYVFWPDAAKLGEKFNGWLYGKLLILVEDIHTTEATAAVLERMKPWITSVDGIEIESKGVDQVSTEVCCNFIINSNHKDGVRKHLGDRRYITFITPQQNKADLAAAGLTPAYFRNLYSWAKDGGYAAIHGYLARYPIPDEWRFDQGLQAPDTSTTHLAVEAGRGRAEQEVMEAIESGRSGFRGGWISGQALGIVLKEARREMGAGKRLEMLRTLGFVPHPGLTDGRASKMIPAEGGKPRLYIRVGHADAALRGEAAVDAYLRAQA